MPIHTLIKKDLPQSHVASHHTTPSHTQISIVSALPDSSTPLPPTPLRHLQHTPPTTRHRALPNFGFLHAALGRAAGDA
jgi:hypothetical protein